MRLRLQVLAIWFLGSCVFSSGRMPDLKVAAVLGHGAVVQRGIPVPVWGWGPPSSRIDVRLANQQKSTTSAADGAWKIVLEPFEAGPLGDMSVSAGKQSLTVKDLLAGEVWVCSGQSNMQMTVSAADGSEEELQRADDPELRLFAIPRIVSNMPVRDIGAQWQRANASTAATFSAVGYYFGRELRRRLRVPVGLIMAAWGGTTAEVWTDAQSLASEPDFQPILARWNERLARNPDVVNSGYPFVLEIGAAELVGADGTRLPLTGARAPSKWIAPVADDSSRVSFNAGSSPRFAGTLGISGSSDLVLDLEQAGKPVDLSAYSALRVRARGRGRYSLQLRQMSVKDWAWHTQAPFFATESWHDYEFRLRDFAQPAWGEQKPLTLGAVSGIAICTEAFMVPPAQPSSLFNSMLRPIMPHAIGGALWYQGEGNAGRAYQYRKLLPALIQGWRREWGQGDFPFYIVQLPGFGAVSENAVDSEWAELREAQAAALALENTGLACTIDIGEPGNVHPGNKLEVGMRLARVALAKTYGKPVEYSGPRFSGAVIEGNRVRVIFDDIGSGLAARGGESLLGFSLAGEDRVFHKAAAAFDGDTVVVESDEVHSPIAVRYAWSDSPVCNLIGADGLPAWPFRSDNWPLKTEPAR